MLFIKTECSTFCAAKAAKTKKEVETGIPTLVNNKRIAGAAA